MVSSQWSRLKFPLINHFLACSLIVWLRWLYAYYSMAKFWRNLIKNQSLGHHFFLPKLRATKPSRVFEFSQDPDAMFWRFYVKPLRPLSAGENPVYFLLSFPSIEGVRVDNAPFKQLHLSFIVQFTCELFFSLSENHKFIRKPSSRVFLPKSSLADVEVL